MIWRVSIVLLLTCLSIGATRYQTGVRRVNPAASVGVADVFTNFHYLSVWYPTEGSLTNAQGKMTNAAPDWSNTNFSYLLGGAAQPTYSNANNGWAYYDGGDGATNDSPWILNVHTTFTVCIWVKHTADFNIWNGDATGGAQYRIQGNAGKWIMNMKGLTDNTLPITSGAWTHLAMSWANRTNTGRFGDYILYTNGILAKFNHNAQTNAVEMDRGGMFGRAYSGFNFTGGIADPMCFTNYSGTTESNMVNNVYNYTKTLRGF